MVEALKELIVDSFAGGGGTSEGIKKALGVDPDYAINHDKFALAMHRINHPGTKHLVEDVISLDSVGMCDGRPIGMLWMSPDCKEHSKAKGGQPRDKNIRGLAWACFGWVKALPSWQRPRVVFLENVEEFADWGPLLAGGKRCPVQKGVIFEQFCGAWRKLGYVVEWRERRAWWSGAGTIRKRLYMIMRRDGEPIVWPEVKFGNPNNAADAARIASGELMPWVTAADSIDFSLPCPSIFETSAEIKAKWGVRANRPLAENTMARVAKGTMRYVVNAAKPFIVKVNHKARGDARDRDLDQPIGTMTGTRGDALVVPHVMTMRNAQKPFSAADEPTHTITAGGANLHVVSSTIAPFVTKFNSGSVGHDIGEPLHTITSAASDTHSGGAAPLGIVTPFLVPRYGDREGQEPRTRPVDVPAPVIVPTGNEGSLAAVHLSRQFGASIGSDAAEPVGTITAVVAAFLAQHNYMEPGHDVREPVSTIVGKGCTQGLVAAHMLNMRGSDRRDSSAEEPLRTASAGGNHAATVYAFLAKYFGAGLPSQDLDDPLHTVTAKPRHGLVTVTIEGEPYVIVDIGMRMLTPRERFNAQGFRRDYIIDRGIFEDGSVVHFTLEQQGYMCGNSVCPTEAEALVAANFNVRDVIPPRRREPDPMPLFQEAAE